MTDLRQAAQQALEALEAITRSVQSDHQAEIAEDAITALRTALEQQQQAEPVQKLVAWGVFDGNLHDMFFTEEEAQEMVRLKGDGSIVKPLYTAPPQRQWQGLTDEDWEHIDNKKETSLDTFAHGAAWAADQLKERNT